MHGTAADCIYIFNVEIFPGFLPHCDRGRVLAVGQRRLGQRSHQPEADRRPGLLDFPKYTAGNSLRFD